MEYDVRPFNPHHLTRDGLSLLLLQRVVMLDSDMIVMRNMDELMELDLPSDWIAAAHACTCNPRKLAHYPEDWWAFHRTSTSSLQPIDNCETGSPRTAHTRPLATRVAIPSHLRSNRPALVPTRC